MDTAYLHIVTNHIPVIGVPFALFLLILGIWRKSDELKAAAFLIFTFLGAATLGVYLLGQGGEDFVEELAGVSHDAIETHEDFAKFALGGVLATALAAAFALLRYGGLKVLKRRSSDKLLNGGALASAGSYFPNRILYAVLALAILSAGLLGYTGKLGGKIRHTEFYGGAVSEGGDTDGGDADEGGKRRRGRDRRN